MTLDDLSLDHATVAAQLEDKPARDPWLARRGHGFGASEVPSLLLAYDPRPGEEESALNHHKEGAAHARKLKISRGFPLVIERKAMRRDLRPSSSMSAGRVRETTLFEVWRERCGPGYYGFAQASSVPVEWLPLVDRECPSLTATPDAWCRDVLTDGLVMAEIKCSFREDAPEWHWYHDAQLQAQIATCSAQHGVLVLGPGWADPVRELVAPPRFRDVEKDEEFIARIRYVCARAWRDVLTIRGRTTA